MLFKEFKNQLKENFLEITKDSTHLFEVNVDKDEMWNLYLDSFPEGTNEIYRERREYDCSCCRQFIKSIGNAVVLEANQVKTIWDFSTSDAKFQPVIDSLSKYIKAKAISDVWVSKFKNVGTNSNFEQLGNKQILEWD